MKSIWLRLQRVMSAKGHAQVNQMENPAEMVDQLLREKIAAITAAKLALARAKVWQENLAKQQTQQQAEQTRLQQLASDALRDEREDLARQALGRKQDSQARSQNLMQQIQQAASLRQQQEHQLEKLQADLSELRNRREILLQRHLFSNAAAGMVAHNQAYSEPSDVVLERMEAKVSQQEMEVAVHLQTEPHHPDQQLQTFERERSLDLELAQLKQSLANA